MFDGTNFCCAIILVGNSNIQKTFFNQLPDYESLAIVRANRYHQIVFSYWNWQNTGQFRILSWVSQKRNVIMHYYQPPNNTPYQFLLDTRLPFHVDINHNVHRNKLMFTDITIPVKGFLCFRVFSLVENKGCNLFYHLLNFHPLSLMRQHLHRNPLNLTRISFLSSQILFVLPMTKLSCLSIDKMEP